MCLYSLRVSANPDLQGFVTGAAANVWLTDRLGFGTVRPLFVRPFQRYSQYHLGDGYWCVAARTLKVYAHSLVTIL